MLGTRKNHDPAMQKVQRFEDQWDSANDVINGSAALRL